MPYVGSHSATDCAGSSEDDRSSPVFPSSARAAARLAFTNIRASLPLACRQRCISATVTPTPSDQQKDSLGLWKKSSSAQKGRSGQRNQAEVDRWYVRAWVKPVRIWAGKASNEQEWKTLEDGSTTHLNTRVQRPTDITGRQSTLRCSLFKFHLKLLVNIEADRPTSRWLVSSLPCPSPRFALPPAGGPVLAGISTAGQSTE